MQNENDAVLDEMAETNNNVASHMIDMSHKLDEQRKLNVELKAALAIIPASIMLVKGEPYQLTMTKQALEQIERAQLKADGKWNPKPLVKRAKA